MIHTIRVEDAPRIAKWIAERGGIAIWYSVNLSNPEGSWTTPAEDEAGNPQTKPSWQSADTPAFIITDPAEVLVSTDVEVKRFHIAIRRGSQGYTVKLTDASSRRVRSEITKAGVGAFNVFDYDTKEAVIMKPSSTIPLSEWLKGGGQ